MTALPRHESRLRRLPAVLALALGCAASAFAAEPDGAAAAAAEAVPRLNNSHCDAYREASSSIRSPKDLGLVVLRVDVSPQGEVLGSEILERTTSNYFAHVVQESFSKCRFDPGHQNGVPVRGHQVLRLKFNDHPLAPNDADCPGMGTRERPPADKPMPALRLRIRFLRTGHVAAVEILQPSGSPALDEAAVNAYRQCHFDPSAAGQPDFQEEWVTTLNWGG